MTKPSYIWNYKTGQWDTFTTYHDIPLSKLNQYVPQDQATLDRLQSYLDQDMPKLEAMERAMREWVTGLE